VNENLTVNVLRSRMKGAGFQITWATGRVNTRSR